MTIEAEPDHVQISRRRFLQAGMIGAGVLALPGVLDACGSSSTTGGGGSPNPKAILQYGEMLGESYDPINQNPTAYTQLYAIFDTLITYDTHAVFQPRLATKWDVTPERIRMQLRKGVVFQDNTPFNAAAVQYSFNRVLHDPASNIKSLVAMVDRVDVVDDYTVEFHMVEDQPQALLFQLADRPGMIVSPDAVKKAGSSAKFSEAPVGAGMYKVQGRWYPREKMSVRAWPGYWDKSAQRLGGVDFTNIIEGARVNALRAGNTDVCTGMLGSDVSALTGAGIKVKTGPGTQVFGLNINPTIAPLDKLEVRQAIACSLDRDAINQALAHGVGTACYQCVSPASPAYDKSLDRLNQYDPKRAKRLLKKAGFADGVSFGSVIGATADAYVQFGELVQSQLKKTGIDMQLKLVNQALTIPMLYHDGGHGSVASAPIGGSMGITGLDSVFRNALLREGFLNAGGVEVPGVRPLLDRAAAASTAAEANRLYQQVNRIVTKGAYWYIPAYAQPRVTAYRSDVGGPITAVGLAPFTPDFLRGLYKS